VNAFGAGSWMHHWWRYCNIRRGLTNALSRVLILGVLKFAGGLALFAQIPIAQMYHKSWTPRDGAPNDIEDIVQGPDGFLWLTTDAGLYRFDGVSFERYTPSNGSTLLSDTFTEIFATRDGSLWISYLFGGLARLKDGHIRNYTEQDGFLPHSQINSLVEDRDGSFWAGGLRGLQKITNSRVTEVGTEEGMPAGLILSLVMDQDGSLWATLPHELMVLPSGSKRFLVAGTWSGDERGACTRSRDGGVLCRQPNGPLMRFQVSGDRILRTGVSPSLPLNSLIQADDGAVWMGTRSNGLRRFYPGLRPEAKFDASHMEMFTSLDGLTGNSAFRIIQDREGSIWMATTNGLDQFRPVPFRALDIGQSAPVLLPQGKLDSHFIVANDHIVDLTTGRPTVLQLSIPEWTRSLYQTEDGTLWIGTNGHIWRYAGERFSAQSLPQNLKGSRQTILAMIEDDSHGMWVSIGQDNGLFRLDRGHWVNQGGYPGFPHGTVLSAARDQAGGLWFGYLEGRVVRLYKGRLREFGGADGLDVGGVKVFTVNATDVWVGGDTGVGISRGDRFFALGLAGSEPIRGVTGLAIAPDGALWINQSTGVFRIEKAEIESWLANPRYLAKYRFFDLHDGLSGIPHPLVGLGSERMAPDGRLYIATRTNLQSIDPLHLPHNDIPPQVWITGWMADGVPGFSPSAPLTFKPRVADLQIDYAATSLLIPDRVRFRYRLEGYDKNWIDAGTRRQAFYSKLPPGTYTFKVIACNDSGLWNLEGANLKFTVPPTFVQTIWFQLLMGVLVLLLLYYLFRLRLRQANRRIRERLYERVAERERIARDLHDTFFQGIQGLLLRFHTTTSGLPSDDPTRQLLENTLKQSDQVMLEGRVLLMDLRSAASEQSDLPAALADYGKSMQKDYGCEFELVVNGTIRPLRPIVCEEVSRIGKEALGNAFRHSKAQSIEAELNYEPNEFRIRIRDDGTGIDSAILEQGQRDGHWGLPGMRERASKIGARLDIWSRAGAGTEIELRLHADLAFAPDLRGSAGKLRRLRLRRKSQKKDSIPN